jgi:hypothetical protein
MPSTRLQTKNQINQIKEMFENVPEPQGDTFLPEDLDSSSDYCPDDEEEEKMNDTRKRLRALLKHRESNITSPHNIRQLPQPSKSPNPPTPKSPQPPKSPSPPTLGTKVLNKKIRVRFGEQWLNGTITEYDANKRLHTISFDDFNHSKLAPINLENIHFEIVEQHAKVSTVEGKVLSSETTTTTYWTTDKTIVTKVTKFYS